MYTYEFTDKERNNLSIILDKVNYLPSGDCNYINALRKMAYRSLPESILDIFLTQKISKNPLPYILLENVPVDEHVRHVPLKSDNIRNAKPTTRSENLLIMLSSILGEPYSMVFEGEEIVNNLISYPENKKDYTGLGSEVELDFHIENAALKHFSTYNFSPNGLMLTGVSYDKNGPLTRVSDGREALKLLSQKHQDALKEKLFRIKVPHRWRGAQFGIKKEMTDWVSLVGEINSDYPDLFAVFYHDMVETMNELAAAAIQAFHMAVKEVSFGLSIKPGQLIYIDNRFAMHSRDKFTPTLDDSGRPKRWLQRVFVAVDLWSHRNLGNVENRVYRVGR